MPTPKPITVRGTTYPSFRAAWFALGRGRIAEITARKRLALGWHPDDIFSVRPVPPRDRRGFKALRVG